MVNPFDDEYFMRKALDEAYKALEKGEVPVGAVIVTNDQIIARGHNLTEQLVDVTAHAEIVSITAASNFLGGKYLNDCTMYVTLEPCQMCAGASNWAQLRKMVFGASDDRKGFRKLSTVLHPKTEVVSSVLEEECSDLIRKFFLAKRNLN